MNVQRKAIAVRDVPTVRGLSSAGVSKAMNFAQTNAVVKRWVRRSFWLLLPNLPYLVQLVDHYLEGVACVNVY